MIRTLRIVLIALAATAAAVASPVVETVQNGGGVPLSALGWRGMQFVTVAITILFGLTLVAFETRRRSAILRLIDQERRFHRRVWDAVASGIAMVDARGRIVEWNPAMERLTGVPWRNALGTLLTECPGLGDRRHRECLRLALQGVEVATKTAAHPRADQPPSTMLRGYYSPVRDANGELSGAFVIITAPTGVPGAAVPTRLDTVETAV